jgi:HK97 family phage portal protein
VNKFTRFFATVFGGFFDKRLWTSIGGTRSTTARVDVSEETALNYAAVWCATRLLCGTGAQLPLPIYRGADDDTREKIKTHPAYRLLNIAPNPEMTAFNFRSILWQWQVNGGNAYAEIVREGNNPEAPLESLWPMDPWRTTIKRDDSGELRYEYREEGGTKVELKPWQVLHLPSIITIDGIVGRGVIEHARETIGAGIAAEKKAANRFGGGNIPAVVVEVAGKWPDDARKAFRDEWKTLYGGPEGDTVALLQGGSKAVPLQGISERDSQFLESRQFDIEEIARWYGIPPHLLQHLLRATFNNVEELGIDFVRYGLNSWLKIWEQAIRQKLFTADEQDSMFAEHNVDALMRGNAAARGAFYQVMTSAAIMSRNECRKLENLDPVEGGDVYLVQGAMVPLDESGKPESAFVNPTTPSTPADTTSSTQSASVISSVAVSVQRIIASDLSRMLTKEAKAMESYAKKPGNFVDQVDEFYAAHRDMVIDVVTESVTAFNSCGHELSRDTLAATWVHEGKSLILEAAGNATATELPEAVQRVIQSKTWSERPQRAVERAENANLVV